MSEPDLVGAKRVSAVAIWELSGDVLGVLPRHRHSLSRDAVRSSQEARLRVATVEVVAERGYSGASVRQIAARAGISTKTFYELYPDKESAFLATYSAVDLLVYRMRVAAAAAQSAKAVIGAGLTTYLATLAANPAFTQSLVVEAVASTDRIRERRSRGLADFAAVLVEGLRRVRGPEGPDPASTSMDRALIIAGLGGVNELVVQHLGSAPASSLLDITAPAQAVLERVVLTVEERQQPLGKP
ncbi:TetR/AcrR family transcriptional regulator [Mycobacterium sp. 852002-51163_SCH5372311]|uniref:TetR/AcrR family transcriptional regulator n=1 Tax=Mycobacterium sp. 852002-51163_SCH5372311 TaxID=1834097 RepID=UPI000ADCBEC8|nr:TetR/AcrR family transcriptional regulator [Mycobacterium sp. 852002-51163_SCH5372311]